MGRLNFGQMASLMLFRLGLLLKISPIIAAISMAESGGNPYAHNPNIALVTIRLG